VELINYETDLSTSFTNALQVRESRFPSFWPADQSFNNVNSSSSIGTFYELTPDELFALQTPVIDPGNGKNVYSVVLQNFTPVTRSTSSDDSPFAGHADIRLTQVRLWLPKIIVQPNKNDPLQRKLLTVGIDQYGDETFVTPIGDNMLTFVHDPISLQWQYDTNGINTGSDIAKAGGLVREDVLADCYTSGPVDGVAGEKLNAAIGPFATWQITIEENLNPGLNLDAVMEVYFEFWGNSVKFL
jgi:hypothetical protein